MKVSVPSIVVLVKKMLSDLYINKMLSYFIIKCIIQSSTTILTEKIWVDPTADKLSLGHYHE